MIEEKTELPEAFAEKMQRLLGSEYEAFAAGYEKARQYGLRRNLLKGTEEEFIRAIPFPLEKISWAREGYYYDAGTRPGRHVLHEAGAYYIQEPSAMAVVEALSPEPGERILDLCAAPGGKSTQIAGRMQGKGLLVSNEVMGERARVLSQNVERMGVSACVVCSEKPERMAVLFPAFFDRVLVDAPCSGEGMFRKDEAARGEWSPESVE
ncbi:MAG: RsmB/NOP family class I SAM-dependent RNA methyltransferase, partial [Lachnospiraceae bacterium]|nr:RsmB/NOP family class I SAM-dependent RNA methyltransferase [Lachnospiraceae bacterium]